jgi:superfamily II DNA/RNA helicase
VYGLHGRMVNEKRMHVSRIFRDINDGPKFLFSTDVAARGLDFPSLSTVFQIGFSGVDDPVSQFVHRAGRTARAGRDGNNILLLCEGLDSDSKLAKQVNELVHLKRLILPQKLTRVEQFDSTSYQRHLSTKCLESLLSWFIERRSGLGIHVKDLKGPGAQLEVKNRIVKAVTDMIRSTGLHQPRISEKTAKKLRIDDLPGLLISKHR